MWKSLIRDRKLISLLILTVLIKLFSLNHEWVERYYTYGLYPYLSKLLRILFGWIPFSVGDLLYFNAGLYLVWKLIRFIVILSRRKVREYLSWELLRKMLRLILAIYIVFNVLWGMNYDRQGIATQLNLKVKPYTVSDLAELASVLQARLNDCAQRVDSVQRLDLDRNTNLFHEGIASYEQVKNNFPFLTYSFPSIKPSMYSRIGHYFGFTGYYNPFSGEAQLKTTVPVFLKPFIICHEMAHQLGYGKENEANFVGYLACKNSANVNFSYSTYFELTLYALSDLKQSDTAYVKMLRQQWTPRVRNDYREYLNYLFRTRNRVEPVVMRFYDQYLKMNNQPKGQATYNEVIAWLIAYMKKYGKEAV